MGLFSIPGVLQPLGPYTQCRMGPQALPYLALIRYSEAMTAG
jgi:hypothetical protein